MVYTTPAPTDAKARTVGANASIGCENVARNDAPATSGRKRRSRRRNQRSGRHSTQQLPQQSPKQQSQTSPQKHQQQQKPYPIHPQKQEKQQQQQHQQQQQQQEQQRRGDERALSTVKVPSALSPIPRPLVGNKTTVVIPVSDDRHPPPTSSESLPVNRTAVRRRPKPASTVTKVVTGVSLEALRAKRNGTAGVSPMADVRTIEEVSRILFMCAANHGKGHPFPRRSVGPMSHRWPVLGDSNEKGAVTRAASTSVAVGGGLHNPGETPLTPRSVYAYVLTMIQSGRLPPDSLDVLEAMLPHWRAGRMSTCVEGTQKELEKAGMTNRMEGLTYGCETQSQLFTDPEVNELVCGNEYNAILAEDYSNGNYEYDSTGFHPFVPEDQSPFVYETGHKNNLNTHGAVEEDEDEDADVAAMLRDIREMAQLQQQSYYSPRHSRPAITINNNNNNNGVCGGKSNVITTEDADSSRSKIHFYSPYYISNPATNGNSSSTNDDAYNSAMRDGDDAGAAPSVTISQAERDTLRTLQQAFRVRMRLAGSPEWTTPPRRLLDTDPAIPDESGGRWATNRTLFSYYTASAEETPSRPSLHARHDVSPALADPRLSSLFRAIRGAGEEAEAEEREAEGEGRTPAREVSSMATPTPQQPPTLRKQLLEDHSAHTTPAVCDFASATPPSMAKASGLSSKAKPFVPQCLNGVTPRTFFA